MVIFSYIKDTNFNLVKGFERVNIKNFVCKFLIKYHVVHAAKEYLQIDIYVFTTKNKADSWI